MTKSTQREKHDAFRALHVRSGAFVIPNPWNAGTARMLESLGFEALATTSAGFAFNDGRGDSAASMYRDPVVENARSIVEATGLPVTADLQNGYGHAPEDCAETMRLAVAAGLVGGSIEDATGDRSRPLYDLEHAVERVAAACEACAGAPFLLTARAEGCLVAGGDLDDIIRRLQAFSRAGADVLYAPGLPDLDAITRVCAEVDKPVNIVMGLSGPTYSLAELEAAGVKRVSVGGAFARAAFAGFLAAAREVREHGTFELARHSVSGKEVVSLLRPAG